MPTRRRMNRTRWARPPRTARWTLLVAAVLGAVLLAVAGCTSSGGATAGSSASTAAAGSGSAATGTSALHWHSCSLGGAGLQCASLRVPLDYARPRRPHHHPGAVPGAGHRASQPAAGRPAGQPGRPGRQRPQPRGVRRRRAQPLGGRRLQHHRLRPAWGGFQRPRPDLRSLLLLRGTAGLHPGQRHCGANPHQPGQELRGGLREALRLAAAVHDVRGRGPGHGLDPVRARRSEDQLLRLLLRDVPGPGLRHAVPAPPAPHGAGQHGGPRRGVVRGQHRPGLRLRGPAWRRSSPGSRPTTSPTGWAAPGRRWIRPGTGPGRGCRPTRSKAGSARTISTTRSCRVGTATRCGLASPQRWPRTCTAAPPARSSASTSRTVCRVRTSSPSTTRWSAAT